MRSLNQPERTAMDDAREGARVLVVEDEWLLRATISAYLRDEGFVVLEAADVDEAAFLLDGAVDVVFTDVRMPGSRNGLDLACWIHETWPTLPVIVASGVPHQLGAAQASSITGPIMDKPYAPRAVARRIRDALARSDHESSAV
jgi:DNA-binding response OmpR family regulator